MRVALQIWAPGSWLRHLVCFIFQRKKQSLHRGLGCYCFVGTRRSRKVQSHFCVTRVVTAPLKDKSHSACLLGISAGEHKKKQVYSHRTHCLGQHCGQKWGRLLSSFPQPVLLLQEALSRDKSSLQVLWYRNQDDETNCQPSEQEKVQQIQPQSGC